ncbi:grass carp reovirus (GCRV)-induced gene 2p [Osmerus mordax]|uniref:grass carp reovirus (GCRV)-induced gene 2p n=1 Tax=Osmerus mordax TaxID=8014 RepID=UPI00350F55D1
MSVSYNGWEVVYDDESTLGVELTGAQTPKDGKTYTMYHGTTVQTARLIIANGFRQSPDGMLGAGVYVSRDQKKAERYPLGAHVAARVVLTLDVDVGRVKRIDKDGHPMQKSWHTQHKYDTAWVPPNCGMKAVPSGLEEDCVFDPQRIRVAGVALAPDSTVLAELRRLVGQPPRRSGGGGAGRSGGGGAAGGRGVCAVCNRKSPPSHTHTLQQCWGCGQKICTFMVKHVCSASLCG